jgi:G3E family GTPase
VNNYQEIPQALGIVGPFGAGKTNTMLELGKSLQDRGLNARAIINDIALADIDSKKFEGFNLSMLTGGCVGCADTAQLIVELHKAKQQNMVVMVEAPATLHASEIKDVIGSVYGHESSKMLTIWDGLGHARNLNYGPAQATLKVGDMIAVTKHDSLESHQIQKIITDIGRLSMIGSSIVFVNESQYGLNLLEKLSQTANNLSTNSHGHIHDESCQHNHPEKSVELPSLNANKQMRWLNAIDGTYGMELRPKSISLPELEIALKKSDAIRAKGVVTINNKTKNLQYTPEQITISDINDDFIDSLNLYVYSESPTKLMQLEEIAEEFKQLSSSQSFKDLIKESKASKEDLEGLIEEKIKLYGSVLVNGELLSDYGEADMAYHIAKQSEGLSENVKKKAYVEYINQRLKAVRVLENNPDINISEWHRLRLGLVLAFHVKEAKQHLLDESMVQSINQAKPFELLCLGLLETSPNNLKYDLNKRVAEENPELIVSLLKYAVEDKYLHNADARQAYETFRQKYINQPNCPAEIANWWKSVNF